ncbi:helicase C-terminal domain-containing protein [Bacillus sp. Marseille-Q1617]|uniref:helicase C-terminal domain-containing protein n=1 Tax=Bacillus sp. Marseille-Q1617 TaxID=2736887 RepID=UPI0020CA7AF2|nr:helicase C-terminal domain-containing protein [Bacillus sp. Marseille-Q1617]
MEKVKVSVRELVEFVYKEGSIDLKFQARSSMTIGTKLHQLLQKGYKEGDEKEVFLKGEIVSEELSFILEGRCDGILYEEEKVKIDEIKSTAKNLSDIENGARVHWAQAECYAYLLASEKKLEFIDVQLTYIQIDTEQVKVFERTYSITDLEDIVRSTLLAFTPFAKVIVKNRKKFRDSISETSFPYPSFRKGQKQLAGAVYKTITEEKSLYANAPTGTGKTISTLFPAMKGMSGHGAEKWFYLTAKTITRTVAQEALLLLEKQGLHHTSVTITAKDKICFKDETKCQKEFCEFADGYYDRINGALIDILSQETVMTREVIEEYALKHKVCPFEFSIDLSYLVDGVICDYNYVFDPKVSLKRLGEESKKKTVLLIDESHNLVDRGREMYSASLTKSSFLEVKSLHQQHEALKKSINAVNKQFLSLKKEMKGEGEWRTEGQQELTEEIEAFVETAEKCLGEQGKEWSESFLQLYFDSLHFVRISRLYSEEHRFLLDSSGKDLTVKLFCIDPSKLIAGVKKPYHSSIFFSATLHPFSYYYQQLGGSEEDYRFLIPSPFEKSQWKVEVHPISTRYKDRTRTLPRIVQSIVDVFLNNEGHFLVFFSSYSYMREAYEELKEHSLEAEYLMQEANMSEEEREAFLQCFQPHSEKRVIGLAVLGGIFSEGIDLKGDRLNGVVVIGVGLPQPGLEQEMMKEYYEENGKNGFDYTYVYPGLNKVFQSGGRLIRSDEDTGVLRLIDDRYLTPKYKRLLPDEWTPFTVIK